MLESVVMRRIPFLIVLVVALVTAALGSAAPAFAISPVQPENRPRPLAGVENGKVPAPMLIQVTSTCVAVREAAPSLHLLFAQARGAGVSLDARECYRPLAGQIRARANATASGNAACAASLATSASGQTVGTSMHGWGKAADFTDAGRSLTFASPGYHFLKSAAAAAGWNHPGWAEPGGSSCPEPWHWEWVGDGGRDGHDPIAADAVALLPAAGDTGHLTVTGLGAVRAAGTAADRGSAASLPLAWVVVSANATPTRAGYWMVAADGGVFSFGDAQFFGSTGGLSLNAPVLGMAPTPTGRGYWLFAEDGGVFSFGDARFAGSTGGIPLFRPVVGMAATPSGNGYWLVASDGGVFSFGDARFLGSTGGLRLVRPVVGMAATPSGKGYWLVASDGGVFSFGDARFFGGGASASGSPVVAITATATGNGYWLLYANGEVAAFGDAS
jgi:hypothetical protein